MLKSIKNRGLLNILIETQAFFIKKIVSFSFINTFAFR